MLCRVILYIYYIVKLEKIDREQTMQPIKTLWCYITYLCYNIVNIYMSTYINIYFNSSVKPENELLYIWTINNQTFINDSCFLFLGYNIIMSLSHVHVMCS